MKFKLDENFGTRTQKIFRLAGHDIHTVFEYINPRNELDCIGISFF